MADVLCALALALRSLLRPAVLWQSLWPPLAALAVWIAIAARLWTPAKAWLVARLPELPWHELGGLTDWLAPFGLLLALAPFVYFTAVLLVAGFALPRMMAVVSRQDYPGIERRGENAVRGSIANTLWAGLVFLVGWLLSLPLLLVPGALVVVPLGWAAWFNQRTFRFDALVEHATRAELKALVAAQRGRLYLAGFATALLAHVPLLNLLAPALTALVYVHLCLAALARQREGRAA